MTMEKDLLISKKRLKLRNRADLGMRTITISIPDELLLALNAHTQDQQRSAFICQLLRQHFGKIEEKDPRYLLRQKQQEMERFEKLMEKRESEFDRQKLTFKNQAEEELEKRREEIDNLKEKVEKLNEELLS